MVKPSTNAKGLYCTKRHGRRYIIIRPIKLQCCRIKEAPRMTVHRGKRYPPRHRLHTGVVCECPMISKSARIFCDARTAPIVQSPVSHQTIIKSQVLECATTECDIPSHATEDHRSR